VQNEFIFRVLTAGSNDQSAREDMLDVVARGMPFKRSSVPPAVVRVAASKMSAAVEMLDMNADSASRKMVDSVPAFTSKTVSVDVMKTSDVKVLTWPPAPPDPRALKIRPGAAYVSCDSDVIYYDKI
jgi:hypothetical protein